jgi:hypothetical protein
MPASRSIVSVLVRFVGRSFRAGEVRWEKFLYELKAGHRGTGLTVQASRRRHRSLIDTSFSPGRGATSGPHPAGPPGTTAVNAGQSSPQVSRPIPGAMLVGQTPRFSLARRKPGVQIPSPPPHNSPGHRPGGSLPPGRCPSKVACRAANGQQPPVRVPWYRRPGHRTVWRIRRRPRSSAPGRQDAAPRVVSELYHATSATWTEHLPDRRSCRSSGQR